MSRPSSPSENHELSISILLEEYRALYGLAVFRMTSLERRVPLFGTVLALFAGSISLLPERAQFSILYGVPIALIWLLRTTINHARSFEDVLRRLAELEDDVNQLAGHSLLRFQSTHPSRGVVTGGRTGAETVLAVAAICVLMLLHCGWVFAAELSRFPAQLASYGFFVVSIALYLAWCVFTLWGYRHSR